jgi:adenylate cyclase
MDEAFFTSTAAWLTEAGLVGASEADIVSGFCRRCVAGGLPLARTNVFIDTLHPVHEGRLYQWDHDAAELRLLEYGRTDPAVLEASGAGPAEMQAAERWRRSSFYRLLQTGEPMLRRRLDAAAAEEFSMLADLRAAGLTDYVAMICRFAADGIIGDMDGVYLAWATAAAEGFSNEHIAALERLAPSLALAFKAAALQRMTRTLMETYLGRDAGQRVLSGRIVRGITERIDAVIWFSDLRGFTRITDAAPEQVIPLLNDYADVIVSAIHERGGDVVKLIGDGVLAIFTAEDREHACAAALAAAIAARDELAKLKKTRSAANLPVTDMYLGLHVGKVFYGNIGSHERLDFTVIGPAVNEASRIAAMCRSADQPLLISTAFAEVGDIKNRLVSVGRFALRGVSHSQELFTLDLDA